MRISRKKRPDKPLIANYRINNAITDPEVRVLDALGNNLGVFPTVRALEMAGAEEKDLVEINPKAIPPVVQLIDFKQFKYRKEKEARKQKAHLHMSETKCLRLSINISDHDLDVRREQAVNFLERGDKAKAEITLRGRDFTRINLAEDVIRKFNRLIEEKVPIRYEQAMERQGNKITSIVAKK